MDYKSSGVNIDAGNEAVELIKPLVKSTYSPQVLGTLGGFAGCFEFPSGYKEPVLVSCTDGVGTKLKLAIQTGIFNTVGIDLVAMSVNDLICCGAKPLFFLDYIACNTLEPQQMKSLVEGIAEGCKASSCSLVGGEMAEMGDMYKKGDVDLAGFAVGVVEKSKMITGDAVSAGDKVYGLPSSGCHSNGYSLLRKIVEKHPEKFNMDELLTPTKIYVDDVLAVINKHHVSAISHITGGGLKENILRLLPEGVSIRIKKSQLPVLPLFTSLQAVGGVSEDEMFRVFNMGIGLVIISPEPLSGDFIELGDVTLGKKEVIIE